MEKTTVNIKHATAKVVSKAMGSNEQFCTPSPSNTHLTTVKLSVNTVPSKDTDTISEIILATNQCKCNDAYIGHVNIYPCACSYGQEEVIWGVDLAKSDDYEEILYMQETHKRKDIPVISIKPLLRATERLFGQYNQQRFPILQGSDILASSRKIVAKGPTWVWALIGIGIPEDRNSGSCLLVEDASAHGDYNTPEGELIGYLEKMQKKITNGITLTAKSLDITLSRIHIGYKYTFAAPGELGCAIACAPFVHLPKNAIPQGAEAKDLLNLSISQWEQALNLPTLKAYE